MSFPKKTALRNLVRIIMSVSGLQLIGQTFYLVKAFQGIHLEPTMNLFFLLVDAWFSGSPFASGAWFPLVLILLGIIALAQLDRHHELKVM